MSTTFVQPLRTHALQRAVQRFCDARSAYRETPAPLTRTRQWRALSFLLLAYGEVRGLTLADARRADRCLRRAEAAAGLTPLLGGPT